MLETLSIDDFAIIKHSEIPFHSGFTVLSGETGAGKSILIDALGLLMGERAEASMIRHGAIRSDIYANFVDIPDVLQNALVEDELDDEDNNKHCLIRRTLSEKSSKVFINTNPVTAAKLRITSPMLLNIHGQNTNQALLKNSEQRHRVDHFGKLYNLLNAVSAAYNHWQNLVSKWQTWQEEKNASEERFSLLEYQLNEFNQLAPEKNEFERLSEQYQLLSASEEIISGGNALTQWLYESDESLSYALHSAHQKAQELSKLHHSFAETADLLSQAAIYVDEANDSLSHALQPIEYDPEKLAELDTRMSGLHQLARKHHINPDELRDFWLQLENEFNQLNDNQTSGETLKAQAEIAQKTYQDAAEKLTQARIKAGKQMAEEVQVWVRQLGMAHAIFDIAIEASENPSVRGNDIVTFMLCANPGQSIQPLAKVASGGELSRVSLAIEVASLDDNAVPNTLIFDEIDAGIGGEVADTVGRLLAKLSQSRQVLCITHLPQVAVWANHHYQISKISDSTSTQTDVHILSDKERVTEIARMMGNASSSVSLGHASAMLEQVSALKRH